MKRLLTILLSLFSMTQLYGQVDDYGLLFKSVGVPQERRTSFEVPQKGDLEFKRSLDIEFDFRLELVSNNYGYILRVVMDDEYSIDLLINNINPPALSLSLIMDGHMLGDCLISQDIFTDETIFERWNSVKLSILPQENRIDFTCGFFNQSYECDSFERVNRAVALFGCNEKPSFATTDVAPVVVKDLTINCDDRKAYCWRFKEHGEDFVYDENSNTKLTVRNPQWTIDKHSKWERTFTLKTQERSFPVFDNNKTIYAITSGKVVEFDLIGGESKVHRSEAIADINKRSTSFVYDYNMRKIKAFDVEDGVVNISTLDLESGDWSPNITEFVPARHTHANILLAPDSSLVQLFGYGFFRFNSMFYNSKGEVKDLSETISPRYLSAVGVSENRAYIFGGVGNKSGKQELGPKLTHDLYEYDFAADSIAKLWEIEVNEKMEVAAKSLVIMPDDKTKALALFFSPLVKESQLFLHEIDLEEPRINKILCDGIPYSFHDISSEAMLVHVASSHKLYAVITHLCDSGEYELNIYSILYPIINKESYYIEDVEATSRTFVIAVVLILAALIAIIIIYARGKKAKVAGKAAVAEAADDSVKEIVITGSESPRPTTHIEIHPQFQAGGGARRLPGIYLLGGFCVIDKDNCDITSEFTPLMKQLLSLIIIYTQHDGRGISNVKLKELLWYDKSDDKARNNRGVNVNKLRQQLKRVGNFNLNFNKSYWFIEYTDTDYCDYVYSMHILSNIDQVPREDVIALLSEISEMGLLLINQTVDFFDNHKAEYTNMVIDKLNHQLAKYDDANDKIALTNLIFKFDAVDEDALRIKCKALIDVGKNGVAKTTFDNFVREYETLFGEPYDKSFLEVTKDC
ncbi:MAG: hypothetical protein SNF93_00750 [Rikenellaceae bacterium]